MTPCRIFDKFEAAQLEFALLCGFTAAVDHHGHQLGIKRTNEPISEPAGFEFIHSRTDRQDTASSHLKSDNSTSQSDLSTSWSSSRCRAATIPWDWWPLIARPPIPFFFRLGNTHALCRQQFELQLLYVSLRFTPSFAHLPLVGFIAALILATLSVTWGTESARILTCTFHFKSKSSNNASQFWWIMINPRRWCVFQELAVKTDDSMCLDFRPSWPDPVEGVSSP